MNFIAVLSCDENPDYLFCLPIVARSWHLQGFKTKIILKLQSDIAYNIYIAIFKRIYRSDTKIYNALIDEESQKIDSPNKSIYVQCCRMFSMGSISMAEDYCIISDADMFIASDFLCRDFNEINSFGHDLTGYQEIPICYVGMTSEKWMKVIEDHNMQNALDKYTKYKSNVWHEAWGADQQILTAKLKEYGYDKINFINRGTDPNNLHLPQGRWDRYGGFKRPVGQIHDVHLPRQPYSDENFPKIVAMCKDIYPNENWDWLYEYRNEFLKTMNIC